MSDHTPETIIATTRDWVEKAVIGLNLCPFAKAVQVKNQIRYTVSAAQTKEQLLTDFIQELQLLSATDPAALDTILLIHPSVLTDFLEYNDFLDVAEATIEDLGFEGEFQIASFHPEYQFADAGPDDIENYTNRSPFPILHLLREASIDRAVDAFPNAEEIYERNMETLRRLGRHGWEQLGLAKP